MKNTLLIIVSVIAIAAIIFAVIQLRKPPKERVVIKTVLPKMKDLIKSWDIDPTSLNKPEIIDTTTVQKAPVGLGGF